MNYNELSKIWSSAGDHMAGSLQINRELAKRAALYKFKNGMQATTLGIWIELIVSGLFFIFLLKFISGHISDVRYALTAFVLLAITLYGFVFEIYRLYLIASVDPSSPVVETQKKLARLQMLEIIDTKSLLIIIPLFSFPFMAVSAKSLLNIDLFAIKPGWTVAYVAGSLVVAAILVVILLRFPSGNLRKTIEFLKELEE